MDEDEQRLAYAHDERVPDAGTFTIDYSFVDDAGQLARVSRQIIVKPDCGKIVNPNNGKPEFLCENKELNERGLLDYVCSKNNYCAGDLTDDIVELVDVFPTLTLKTVPGVIEKTVITTTKIVVTDRKTGEQLGTTERESKETTRKVVKV